jgi:hypothetical protein
LTSSFSSFLQFKVLHNGPEVPLLDPIIVPPSTLSLDMASLVNREEFSDVKFIIDGHEETPLFAWKGILCARSDFFRAM